MRFRKSYVNPSPSEFARYLFRRVGSKEVVRFDQRVRGIMGKYLDLNMVERFTTLDTLVFMSGFLTRFVLKHLDEPVVFKSDFELWRYARLSCHHVRMFVMRRRLRGYRVSEDDRGVFFVGLRFKGLEKNLIKLDDEDVAETDEKKSLLLKFVNTVLYEAYICRLGEESEEEFGVSDEFDDYDDDDEDEDDNEYYDG